MRRGEETPEEATSARLGTWDRVQETRRDGAPLTKGRRQAENAAGGKCESGASSDGGHGDMATAVIEHTSLLPSDEEESASESRGGARRRRHRHSKAYFPHTLPITL